MTTPNEAREAVYLRFTGTFVGVTADRIALDNEEFNEPETGNWVRLVVRHGGRAQETLGKPTNRRFRSEATVFVQVYTPTDVGMKTGDLLAKAAANIFEGVSFSGLDFREATVNESGPDGRWYQHLVEAVFDYEEIK